MEEINETLDYFRISIYNVLLTDDDACRICGGIGWEDGEDEGIFEREKSVNEYLEKEVDRPNSNDNDRGESEKIEIQVRYKLELNKVTKQHIQTKFFFHQLTTPYTHVEGLAIAKLKNKIEEIDDEVTKSFMDTLTKHLVNIIQQIIQIEVIGGKGDNSENRTNNK